MKLRLILGRAGHGKTHKCLEEILSRMNHEPDGHPLIFIVPEQATFALERMLAQGCGNLGFMRAYVVGFRRLAYRVLTQTGGGARPHITDLGKRLAISRILMEHKEDLKILGQMPQESTLPSLLTSLLKDFKNYSLSSESLAKVSQNEENAANASFNSSLRQKLSDLTLVYEKFDEFLSGRYTDPEDYIKLLAEKILMSDLVKDAEIWVDGFSWFTPQEYAALESLLKTSRAVNLTLCLDDPENPVHERQEALFNNQWHTRRRLLDLAYRLKCHVEEEELTIAHRFSLQPLLARIERNFAYNFFYSPPGQAAISAGGGKTAQGQEDQSAVTIAEAANQKVEAELIAREIIRLSRECGLRFKEMAVILRDDESYQELIEAALAEHDIPFFSDSNRLVIHHPLAELVRAALDIVLENWNYEAVFRALKTDFFNATRDEVDILENYSLEFGLRGKRWLDNRPWAFYRFYSLGEDNLSGERENREKEFLSKINNIRFRVTPELINFNGKLSRNLPVENFAQALYEFLAELGAPDILDKWASEAENAGDLEQAREHRQIWQAIIELLDQLVETFRGQTLTLSMFAALVNEGLSGLSLSLIPPGLDYVTVSNVKRTRLSDIKAVFLPGLNDGIFPSRYQDAGLISDSDRELLRAAGVELPGGMQDHLFAEQFLVYTALTRASRRLWASYSLAGAEGKALSPSLVVKRLKEISGVSVKYYPPQPPPGSEKEYVSTPLRTVSMLTSALRMYKETKTLSGVWRDVYNWALAGGAKEELLTGLFKGLFHDNKACPLDAQLAKELFYSPQSRLRGSVTRFESFQACPFQHFAKYGLKLKERPVYKLEAPDLGQFLHAVMKNFGVKAEEEGKRWAELTHEEAGEWAGQIAARLAPELQNEILTSSPQYEQLLKNLEKKVSRSVCRLVDFAQKSRFEPLALEQSFGRGANSLPPLTFDLSGGSKLEVSGQIDRIDSLEHEGKRYVLIIDYKSGGGRLTLNEMFHGLKLQLVTYLLAVSQGGWALPAGAVYCYLKNPIITAKTLLAPKDVAAEINKSLKMSGWLLADWEIIKMLDGSLPGNSEFFKIGAKADGTFYANSLSQLKSPEEFAALLAWTSRRLEDIGESILTGRADISPFRLKNQNEPCGYCLYQEVCQFDRYLEGNEYNNLPNMSKEEIFKKIFKEGFKLP